MKAAVLSSPGTVSMTGADIPDPRPEEVVVRMEGCGLCASNIPLWEGRTWFTYPAPPGNPGHEGWGRVHSVGEGVSGLAPGDTVTLLSYNGFAEYDRAHASSVVKLPEELAGRPFPGEAVGCAMNVFRRSGIRSGETVAVVGTGFLGVIVAALAARAGARVIALSRRRYSLDVARSYGAEVTIPMEDHYAIIEEVKGLTGGAGCDRVVEATGMQWPLDLAGELVKERGLLVIAGFHQDGLRQVNIQLWNWKGIDVVNAHERDPARYVEGMREAAAAVAEGNLDLAPLCTHRFDLDELGRGFEALTSRPDGFMKAYVTMG